MPKIKVFVPLRGIINKTLLYCDTGTAGYSFSSPCGESLIKLWNIPLCQEVQRVFVPLRGIINKTSSCIPQAVRSYCVFVPLRGIINKTVLSCGAFYCTSGWFSSPCGESLIKRSVYDHMLNGHMFSSPCGESLIKLFIIYSLMAKIYSFRPLAGNH